MAFVKFWTEAFGDSKFISLNATDRGVFFGLLIECKRQLDDGYVRFKNYTNMASVVHCDRRTCDKCVAKLSRLCIVTVKQDGFGNLELYLPNYIEWQEATSKEVVAKNRKYAANMQQKCSLLDQTRLEEIRAEENSNSNKNSRVYNPNKIQKVLNNPKKAIQLVEEWDKEHGDALLELLAATPGYEYMPWIKDEWKRFCEYASLEDAKVKKSLANNYGGDVGAMFKAWLRRSKTSGRYNDFVVGKV